MIFITVGTHEQPFDRLLKWVDKLVEDGTIKEEIICQKGYTNYEPQYYKTEKMISFKQMQEYFENARIVITHGGPASFISPLSKGKIPIVVPRKRMFNEHVNDHQMEFCIEVEKKMKNIIVVKTQEEFKEALLNYEMKISVLNKSNTSNNSYFNEQLIELINKMNERK